jgi:transposase
MSNASTSPQVLDKVPPGYVSAAETKVSKHRLRYLRESGKLAIDSDCVFVKLSGLPARSRWYYWPAAVRNAIRKVESPLSEKLRAAWEPQEGTNKRVDQKTAAQILGVSLTALIEMTDGPCEDLPGKRSLDAIYVQTSGGRERRYWLISDLELARRNRRIRNANTSPQVLDKVPAGYVSAAETKVPSHRLQHLRESGKLSVGSDCVLVKLSGTGGPPRWYYRPTAVRKALTKVESPLSEKLRAIREARQKIGEGTNKRAAQKTAAQILGVSVPTLIKMTDGPCEHLPGKRSLDAIYVQTVGGREWRYWLISDLEEARRNRRITSRDVAGEDTYSIEVTSERTNISKHLLLDKDERERLGLPATFKRVMVGTRRRQVEGRQRRCTERIIERLAFSKASVDAYCRRVGVLAIPPGMMLPTEAAKELGVNVCTIYEWLKNGILRGLPPQRYRKSFRKCSLIEVASVKEVKSVIRQQGGIHFGRRPNGLREGLKRLATSRTRQTNTEQPAAARQPDQSPAPTRPSNQEAKKRRPKRRDPQVIEVERYCYEQGTSKSWSNVATEAQATFKLSDGYSPPRDRFAACELAKRHARHNTLPWPLGYVNK